MKMNCAIFLLGWQLLHFAVKWNEREQLNGEPEPRDIKGER
jgi:hypothetical protein